MEIKRPKCPNDLSDFERMHIPDVEIPYKPIKGEIFELIVNIGKIMHIMEEEHFIQSIELYNGDVLLDTVHLGPFVRPECVFNVSFSEDSSLRIIAACNLHGAWEKLVKVEFKTKASRQNNISNFISYSRHPSFLKILKVARYSSNF